MEKKYKERYKKTIYKNKGILEDFMVRESTNIYDIKFINYYLKKFKARQLIHKKQSDFLENNVTIRNLQNDIVDAQAYFLASKPLDYTFKNSANNAKFISFFEKTLLDNDDTSKNLEFLKESLKMGQSYEIVHYQKNKETGELEAKYTLINASNCFLIFSNEASQRILCAFVIDSYEDYLKRDIQYTLTQITPDLIIKYNMSKNYEVKADSLISEEPNILGKVNVSITKATKDNLPAYENSVSSILRLDYFDRIIDGIAHQTIEPLIILKNLSIPITEEELNKGITQKDIIDRARETGNLAVNDESLTATNSDVQVLESKTTILEVKALIDDILLEVKNTNGLLDMSNTTKANASADSLKYKFVDLDRKVSNLEPLFKMALRNRIKLLVRVYNYFNYGAGVDDTDIEFNFVKNLTVLSENKTDDHVH